MITITQKSQPSELLKKEDKIVRVTIRRIVEYLIAGTHHNHFWVRLFRALQVYIGNGYKPGTPLPLEEIVARALNMPNDWQDSKTKSRRVRHFTERFSRKGWIIQGVWHYRMESPFVIEYVEQRGKRKKKEYLYNTFLIAATKEQTKRFEDSTNRRAAQKNENADWFEARIRLLNYTEPREVKEAA